MIIAVLKQILGDACSDMKYSSKPCLQKHSSVQRNTIFHFLFLEDTPNKLPMRTILDQL